MDLVLYQIINLWLHTYRSSPYHVHMALLGNPTSHPSTPLYLWGH